ncbi:MAG: PPOX class F420-dependent oxidoreductase [Myxococcota bacterium]|nr:PPOX class F420-dependent oxidoreductase [Myxococcota bacterium]
MKLCDDAKRLIDGANFAHFSTIQEDGSPKVEPVWLGREGDRVLVTSDANSLKGKNIERDPRVALSIVAFENPYEQLLIRGSVVEIRPDDDLAFLDSLAQKYTSAPFGRRKWRRRAVYVIEPKIARYYQSPLVHNPLV